MASLLDYVYRQSPIIIESQSPSPYHQEQVNDRIFPFYEEHYSQVLGHGFSHGVFQFYPDPEEVVDSVLSSELFTHFNSFEQKPSQTRLKMTVI